MLVRVKQSNGTEKDVYISAPRQGGISSRSYSRGIGDGETSSSKHNEPSLSYRELQRSKENKACCIGRKARERRNTRIGRKGERREKDNRAIPGSSNGRSEQTKKLGWPLSLTPWGGSDQSFGMYGMRQAAGTRNSTSRASQQSIPSGRDAFAEADYLKMNSLASCSSQGTENSGYHTSLSLCYTLDCFSIPRSLLAVKTGRKTLGGYDLRSLQNTRESKNDEAVVERIQKSRDQQRKRER